MPDVEPAIGARSEVVRWCSPPPPSNWCSSPNAGATGIEASSHPAGQYRAGRKSDSNAKPASRYGNARLV
jgi:hypothetical protein